MSLIVETSETLTVTVEPDNAKDKTVIWTTSNADIATVNNGVVTAKSSAGTAIITATSRDGRMTAECFVTVGYNVTGVTLEPKTATIRAGETLKLIPKVRPEDAANKKINWTTSNPAIATITDSIVTAISVGTAIITVTTEEGDFTATSTITIQPGIPVTGITLDLPTAMIEPNKTLQLTATIQPDSATNKSVTWKSSNTNIATVNSNGLVTAKNNGTATITVTTEDGGKMATCEILVSSEEIILPILTTINVEDITAGTATLGGNITNFGTPVYTERGVCYSTSQNPTTNNNKILVPGGGGGIYTTKAFLTANTTYYVRAYAKNIGGTAYGEQQSFKTLTASIVGPETVFVQGGTFRMGCTAEQGVDCESSEYPSHQVTLSNYSIGKYLVTQDEWIRVMGNNPSANQGHQSLPVESINWYDIVGSDGSYVEIKGIKYYENGYIYKLNQLTGKQYRLPTEAEWEYAARGGKNSQGYKYSGGNNLDNVAWYSANSGGTTHLVGLKNPNELGIFDMSGNVWEWCGDSWRDYSADNQTNPFTGEIYGGRIMRGGSWERGDVYNTRVSFRSLTNSILWISGIDAGFRLVSDSQ